MSLLSMHSSFFLLDLVVLYGRLLGDTFCQFCSFRVMFFNRMGFCLKMCVDFCPHSCSSPLGRKRTTHHFTNLIPTFFTLDCEVCLSDYFEWHFGRDFAAYTHCSSCSFLFPFGAVLGQHFGCFFLMCIVQIFLAVCAVVLNTHGFLIIFCFARRFHKFHFCSKTCVFNSLSYCLVHSSHLFRCTPLCACKFGLTTDSFSVACYHPIRWFVFRQMPFHHYLFSHRIWSHQISETCFLFCFATFLRTFSRYWHLNRRPLTTGSVRIFFRSRRHSNRYKPLKVFHKHFWPNPMLRFFSFLFFCCCWSVSVSRCRPDRFVIAYLLQSGWFFSSVNIFTILIIVIIIMHIRKERTLFCIAS